MVVSERTFTGDWWRQHPDRGPRVQPAHRVRHEIDLGDALVGVQPVPSCAAAIRGGERSASGPGERPPRRSTTARSHRRAVLSGRTRLADVRRPVRISTNDDDRATRVPHREQDRRRYRRPQGHMTGLIDHEHLTSSCRLLRRAADLRLPASGQRARRDQAVGRSAGRLRRVLLRGRPARDHRAAGPRDAAPAHAGDRRAVPRAGHRSGARDDLRAEPRARPHRIGVGAGLFHRLRPGLADDAVQGQVAEAGCATPRRSACSPTRC